MHPSQLYELSLAIGQSIDLQENCEHFLSALMTVKQLSHTSVWLKSRLLREADASFGEEVEARVEMVYANPRERFEGSRLHLDHPAFQRLAEEDPYSMAPPGDTFRRFGISKRIHEGAIALFSLGDLGFLLLYTLHRRGPFPATELTELSNIIYKFTISLEGCLDHHQLRREVILRKRAQAAVRHREEHFRALIENALDIIMILNYDGSITFASPSVERLLGVAPEELEGQNLFELVHPEEAGQLLHTFQRQVMAPGINPPFEIRFRHRNGSWRNFSVSTNNLLSTPSVGGIIINCNDVTERNLIREALRRSEERYSLAARGANDGIWDWDLARDEIYLSSRWSAMLGYSDGEIGSAPSEWFDRVLPEDLRGLEASLAAHMEGRSELFEHEYRMQHRDGSVRWMLSRGLAVQNEDGKPYRIAGSQTDITDRVEHTTELEEARHRAIEASRAKGEFLANMSHEIRTPMNGVIGMASLLLTRELQVDIRDYVETIRLSGESLLAIVNDILDFSKIESGKLEIERAPFTLRSCIEGALDVVASLAADKGLDLAYWLDDGVPREMVGDAARTRQVLVNLLSNALKFTEHGGVLITVSLLPAAEEGGDSCDIQLSVKDTGIGINQQTMAELFEPFSQADASITRKYGGTGLGLAICKRLTELMGGRIWVDSTPGEGSTFSFVIRGSTPRGTTGEERRELLPAHRGCRLLLVDDNPMITDVLTRQVLSWGMQAEVESSAAHVVDRLEKDPGFDAVVCKAGQPAKDGLTLVRAIRDLPATAQLPVVLVSAFGRDPLAEAPHRPSRVASLTKPVKEHKLAAALSWMLAGEQEAPAATAPASEQHAGAAAEMPPLRILLAEDNPVNRKVAMLMLADLGYRADVATNGAEVLEALEQQAYDTILMDIQMPELDGLEATRRIRRAGGRQPHVIAMTAHAMADDRDRCLAAGMDGYLSKPIKIDELRNALLGVPIVHRVGREPEDEPPVELDQERLGMLRNLGSMGDENLFVQMIDAFLDDAPGHLTAIRNAINEQSGEQLQRAAHSLKGSALNVGASSMAGLCKQLERAGTEMSFDGTALLLHSLEESFARTQAALEVEKGA